MPITLKKSELHALNRLLEILDDRLSSAGCNDFELENTEENRRLVSAAELHCCGESPEIEDSDDKIMTMDSMILDYLKHRLNS